MINKIKDFYFKYAPTFTERYWKANAFFLISKYVKDIYSNIAVVDKKTNLALVDKEFKMRNRESVYYSFEKLQGLKSLYIDDYLIYENIDTLYTKYVKLKTKDIELIEVNTAQLQDEYKQINDKCYSSHSYDNPYSNLDNIGYCNSVIDYQQNESETRTTLLIIKYKRENVGCINLTIKEDLCYISGLAILEYHRKTKVFLAMIDVLKILKQNNVKTIFCVTEFNEYPDKLYKKLGFKSISLAYAYGR